MHGLALNLPPQCSGCSFFILSRNYNIRTMINPFKNIGSETFYRVRAVIVTIHIQMKIHGQSLARIRQFI